MAMDREFALTMTAGVMTAVVQARLLPIRLILLIGGVLVAALVVVLELVMGIPTYLAVLLSVVAALAVIAGFGVWVFEWVVCRLIRFIAPPRSVPTEVAEGLERAGIPAGPILTFRFLRRSRRHPDGIRGEVLATIERVRDLPELLDSLAPEYETGREGDRDRGPRPDEREGEPGRVNG